MSKPSAKSWTTFDGYLKDVYPNGGYVNEIFEEKVYRLVAVLSRIVDVFATNDIAYELIGGLAVLAHVEDVAPDEERTTRDVDLMVNRDDLEAITVAAAKKGFRFRHVKGVDMLMVGVEDNARDAIRLIFANENTSSTQLIPNPPLNPVPKTLRGKEVMLVPIDDLVQMKLTTFRLKDQVHIQGLDRAGLITPEIETQLVPELAARLQQVRKSE